MIDKLMKLIDSRIRAMTSKNNVGVKIGTVEKKIHYKTFEKLSY